METIPVLMDSFIPYGVVSSINLSIFSESPFTAKVILFKETSATSAEKSSPI